MRARSAIRSNPFAGISPPIAKNFRLDRKSTRLNSSHQIISYAVFCLKKKKKVPSSQRKGAFMNVSHQIIGSAVVLSEHSILGRHTVHVAEVVSLVCDSCVPWLLIER